MRVALDLDDSLLAGVQMMADRDGVPVSAVIHRLLRQGITSESVADNAMYETPTYRMGGGREGIDLTKARLLADDCEDAELMRRRARLSE